MKLIRKINWICIIRREHKEPIKFLYIKSNSLSCSRSCHAAHSSSSLSSSRNLNGQEVNRYPNPHRYRLASKIEANRDDRRGGHPYFSPSLDQPQNFQPPLYTLWREIIYGRGGDRRLSKIEEAREITE